MPAISACQEIRSKCSGNTYFTTSRFHGNSNISSRLGLGKRYSCSTHGLRVCFRNRPAFYKRAEGATNSLCSGYFVRANKTRIGHFGRLIPTCTLSDFLLVLFQEGSFRHCLSSAPMGNCRNPRRMDSSKIAFRGAEYPLPGRYDGLLTKKTKWN